MNGIVEGV